MGYCNSNTVTPRMIRRGQVNIGDKIIFEAEDAAMVSGDRAQESAALVSVTQAGEAIASSGSGAEIQEGSAKPRPAAIASAAQRVEVKSPCSTYANGVNVQRIDVSKSDVPQVEVSRTEASWSDSPPEEKNAVDQAASPNSGAAWEVTQKAPHSTGTDAPTVLGIESFPLAFEQMTEYTKALNDGGSVKPTYYVPSSPMVPPEYEQALDYDSIQFLNGFLATQLGRYVKLEQLMSSNIVTDRYGFLVGVGSNYVLLQEITTGNILVLDYYSIKFAYVYYAQPVFPTVVPPPVS